MLAMVALPFSAASLWNPLTSHMDAWFVHLVGVVPIFVYG
jgi:hypothetical protein